MSDMWQELGQRERPAWFIRNGMWIMLLWTVVLFAIAATLPFGNIVTAPFRLQSSATAVVLIPRNAAESIHPPTPATVIVGEREIAATVTEILPSGPDRAALRVRISHPLPPNTSGTVSIRLASSPLLKQLLKSTVSK